MINTFWLLVLYLVLLPVVGFAQIKPGLYTDCDKTDCYSVWFVEIKGDTAITEEFGKKKANVWIYKSSQDTLLKHTDGTYTGTKYSLKLENGSVHLSELLPGKKKNRKIRLMAADSQMRENRVVMHNIVLMWKRDIYKRHSLTIQYLRESSQNVDDIINAFDDLEQKLYLDQQSFLVELQKFEAEYLKRKIIIED